MARLSKWMIGTVPKGTAGQPTTNRHVPKPIWNMSSNTCKIPEVTGKQPLKEGELKCYKCGQKGHMRPQCLKLRGWHIAAVREGDSEEIVETIKENLKEDTKDNVSKGEEIPLKEEENLNESSDEAMYLWDEGSTRWTMFNFSVTRQLLKSRCE